MQKYIFTSKYQPIYKYLNKINELSINKKRNYG